MAGRNRKTLYRPLHPAFDSLQNSVSMFCTNLFLHYPDPAVSNPGKAIHKIQG